MNQTLNLPDPHVFHRPTDIALEDLPQRRLWEHLVKRIALHKHANLGGPEGEKH